MGLFKSFNRMFRDASQEGCHKEKEFIKELQSCKQGAAPGVSKLLIKDYGSAIKAIPPPFKGCVLAEQPVHTGNQIATAATWTGHVLPCSAPNKQAVFGHDSVNHRGANHQNLLQEDLYAFMSDVDRIGASQAFDFCEVRNDAKAQYRTNELFDVASGSDSDLNIKEYLLSPPHTEHVNVTYCSVSSHIHNLTALPSTHTMLQYSDSQMALDGNAPAGCNGVACNASFEALPINKKVVEQKQPPNSNVLAVGAALPDAMKRSAWSHQDYVISKQLHSGYASKVYSAECNASGLKVLLKAYTLENMNNLQRCQLFREISIHSKLQHQNIVQFYCAFMEENCVIIVQEFAAGGDLLHYMYKMGGRLTEKAAVEVVLQPLLNALHYLHTEGIIHRDIKPENCLLTGDMVLQIADFGLAVDLKEERANTRAGTLASLGAANELAADCWSVGILAYELLCGKPPFTGSEMLETAHNIIRGDVRFPKELSPGAVDFISCCLEPNPANRLTVVKMLNNPWIKMVQQPQHSRWQQLCKLTTSHSQRTIPLPGYKSFCHETPALEEGYFAQPMAIRPASRHEVKDLQVHTKAHGVKLNYHINTIW